jgi:putative ABC transport system permease protein
MESWLQDLRYGIRNLGKTRGLTTVAIITLALGIGANTAIFSVIDAVLLRPLPFHNPGSLVRVYQTEAAPGNFPFSGPDFLDWKKQNHSFEDMSLYGWGHDMNLSDAGRADHVVGVPTESNFFTLLGARPLLGRTWAPGEDEPGKDNMVILSFGLWQSHFGGDSNIIGRNLELDAKKYTVIGVMPAGFHYPSIAQFWMPQPMDANSLFPRGTHWASVIGRLKPAVTIEQAQAEMTLIAKRLEEQYPDSNHKVGASLVPLHEDLVGESRDSLLIMLWAVALVLLIACANVANLLLSRSVARQKEMAIRSALGADRVRLVRQLLTESVVLAMTGGLLGLALAAGCVRLLATLKYLGIPRANPVQLNLFVLTFTFIVAVTAGVLFGIFPALQSSRPEVYDELKGGAGSSPTPTRQRRVTSNLLVVAEMGLSLLLLISASLLLKDFVHLRNANVGVRPEGVWTAAIQLPKSKYDEQQQRLNFSQALLARTRQLPGVESAALSTRVPLEGGSNSYVKIRGQLAPRTSGPLVESHSISPGYFHAMGIPLLRGRDFTAEDISTGFALDLRAKQLFDKSDKPPAEETNNMVYPAVINEAMARRFWPNEDPLGKLYSPGSDNGPWRQVIGVVGDVKQWSLSHEPVPEGYTVLDGDSSRVYLIMHTTVPPATITGAVRHAVAEFDSSLPLFGVRTMDAIIAEHAAGQQFVTLLLGSFAGLALLLAAVGIYGVLSHLVSQRTREIGIRISLGATSTQVLRLVLGHGIRLALWGFALGIAAAIAARKLLASSLHMIKASDPLIYVVTVLCLAMIALLACYLPARRAARVDPVIALRYE